MHLGQQHSYWNLAFSVLLCLFVSSPVDASEVKSPKQSQFLEGGVKGAATLRPSLKVIQPEDNASNVSGHRTPQSDFFSRRYDDSFEARRDRLKQLKREKRKRRKKMRRKRHNRQGRYIDPITTYKYSVKKGMASTPEKRFSIEQSERADAMWIRSLTKNILKNPTRSYIPKFASIGYYENKERKRKNKRKRMLAKSREMRGYGVYSSKRKEFVSPGYSVSFSSSELEKSTLGGSWFLPKEPPVPLIAKAGKLSDPIFVQPVVMDPVGLDSEFRAAPQTQGRVWSNWYKETARVIYKRWAQTDVGPGMVRVRIVVSKNKKLKPRILMFMPAPYVTRDGIQERAFRQAAIGAIRQVSSFEIPKFPVAKNRVIFEVEMKRIVDGPSGIEIAMGQDPQVDQLMQMIEQLSPKEQKQLLKELSN